MNNPRRRSYWYAATLVFLTASPAQGKELKSPSPAAGISSEKSPNVDPRVLERMLLAIRETAFYTQRQCELYLAVARAAIANTQAPSLHDWAKARSYFRDDMLIWEEVRNTSFYHVSPSAIEAEWKRLVAEKTSAPLSNVLQHLQVQDSELRRVLEQVLIIQNAKSMKSKLSTIEAWVSTLEKKFHSRFFDNTDVYIPIEPLVEKALTP